MTETKDIYQMLGESVGDVVVKAVKEAFRLQGRSLTGKLIDSIEYNVSAMVNRAYIEFTLLDYGMVLNYGVPPDRIPFTEGSGAKGSKYIDGLKMFAKLKFGVNDKDALGIAFAIAKKHKKYGMPLDKKIGAVTDGIEDSKDEVVNLINDALSRVIQVLFVGAFVEVQKLGSKSLKINIPTL